MFYQYSWPWVTFNLGFFSLGFMFPHMKNIPYIILSTKMLRQQMHYMCVICACYMCNMHYDRSKAYRTVPPSPKASFGINGISKLNYLLTQSLIMQVSWIIQVFSFFVHLVSLLAILLHIKIFTGNGQKKFKLCFFSQAISWLKQSETANCFFVFFSNKIQRLPKPHFTLFSYKQIIKNQLQM